MDLSEPHIYTEDEMLMLSGIQHFVYCQRQWALSHMDQQWEDSHLTLEGAYIHENVDDENYRKTVKGVLSLHGVRLSSSTLGLSGIADVIELLPTDSSTNAITYKGKPYIPRPVEYKHGSAKREDCDIMQLVAQIVCLEEEYNIKIQEGEIFYFKTKKRLVVDVTDNMRRRAKELAAQMHELFQSGKLPDVTVKPVKCRSCSLNNLCMPELHWVGAASNYLKKALYEED